VEGNISGRHTLSGAGYMRGGGEMGRFLVRWEWPRHCHLYRVNNGRGCGSTQVLVGRFKLFGYGRGRMILMNALVLLVAYDF
jgi:hypothetical protein